MAVNLNIVVLAGRLTRDVDLRETTSGTAVANMSLAVNHWWRTADGARRQEAVFVDLVAWGGLAKICATNLRKGSPVLVRGRLQYNQWETEGGERRSRLRVVVEEIQFLAGVRRGGGDEPVADDGEPPAAEPVDEDIEGGDDDDDGVPF